MEVEQPDERSEHVRPGDPTLLERGFPFREVSLVIKADRRANDPVYGAHRWWARRPPALLRAILLAAAQPHDVDLVNRPGSDGGSCYWVPTPAGSACWAA